MMGTLAKKAQKEGIMTCIVTGDMDMLQLIEDGDITVVFPHKGYREPTLYTSDKVFDKYGIHPNQVVDYKALMGDSSDNIKGVEGIGPKGASTLLSEYKTLDGIYEHIEDIASEKMRERLIRGQDSAYFSQTLARIVTDVPCDFKKEDMVIDRLDYLGLKRFCETMEMKSLERRLLKAVPPEKLQSKEQMSMF
jgi:DNA polymerase-1